ncbi:MAG: type IIL restriction-modification enzyme MmeI [Mariprofundus sp.]
MFAEDIELLPEKLFTRMLEACERTPERFAPMVSELFAKMNTGGYFGADEIAWFNGGLFDGGDALPMNSAGIKHTLIAARTKGMQKVQSLLGVYLDRSNPVDDQPWLSSQPPPDPAITKQHRES